MSWIGAQLSVIRGRGYSLLRMPRAGNHSSATLAVPITHDGEVIGVLSMTTFGQAMTKTAIASHVPVLRQTAETIGVRVGEHIESRRQARVSKRTDD